MRLKYKIAPLKNILYYFKKIYSYATLDFNFYSIYIYRLLKYSCFKNLLYKKTKILYRRFLKQLTYIMGL